MKLENKKLCKRYPFLIPYNAWSGKIPKDYDYSYTEYDCIDKGWRIGFGKFLLEDLRKACIETNFLNDLRFLQIKEKYASLRMYTNGAPKKVGDVIDAYEKISESVCIDCGSIKAHLVNKYGWWLPVCKECCDKHNKDCEKWGFKTKTYEEVLGENHFGLRDYYEYITYHDGKDEVVRVDISDKTDKIRKAYDKRMRIKNKKNIKVSTQ